jgi:hypothetical protein
VDTVTLVVTVTSVSRTLAVAVEQVAKAVALIV